MTDKTFSIEERTNEEYDWENDTMKIIQKTVTVIDSMRMNEIVTHYECDLSDLREWLDMKNRVRSGFATNADRIRAMTDEELAEWFAGHDAGLIANVLNNDYVEPTKDGWLEWLETGE